jgi:UDP-N-acetylglucosamine pyrophosphorylase
MVDHLAWAEGYRNRAARCQLSATNTSSTKFGNCYRLLSQYYIQLASLEENFERRQIDSSNNGKLMPSDELPHPGFTGESTRSRLAIVTSAE